MTEIRCIGICTGRGDAPGLNAVIRAAVESAILKYHWKAIGIPDGFDGRIWPERSHELNLLSTMSAHLAPGRNHHGHDESRQSLQVQDRRERPRTRKTFPIR